MGGSVADRYLYQRWVVAQRQRRARVGLEDDAAGCVAIAGGGALGVDLAAREADERQAIARLDATLAPTQEVRVAPVVGRVVLLEPCLEACRHARGVAGAGGALADDDDGAGRLHEGAGRAVVDVEGADVLAADDGFGLDG